ncbi:hypothetical protein ABZ801_00970 [Actinomadura sp. NPDC047616]|uniref:hypothetical protein n=1 Tax=Actinomadura sp. NPDC047616 TaxID=3155914 RepID=UPI0033F49C73
MPSKRMSARAAKDTIDFLRLGFSGHVDTLNFLVKVRQFDTFKEALTIPEIHRPGLVEEFQQLWDDIGAVELGRESSFVMYVHIPGTQQHRNGGDNAKAIKIPNEERSELTQRVLDAGKRAGADERTVQQSCVGHLGESWMVDHPGCHPTRVRLWWD